MGWRSNRTRRAWLASCASTAAGISILAGCTSDSSEPADDESEDDDALAADTWPMYGVDPQNTGYHPTATGPTSEDVQVSKLFDGEGSISNSPVIVDGTLYVIATTRLHAIDLETGELEWQKEVNASPTAHPAADNERVFAGTRDGIVAADLEDGEVQWRNDIGISSVNPVPVNDGVVGTQNLFLHHFDVNDGDESTLHNMRDHQGGRPYTEIPAVSNGNAYFVSGSTVYAVTIEDSKIQWQFESPTKKPLGESNPVVSDTTVYVGGEDQRLYAIKNGREEWSVEINAKVECSPSVSNGIVYFGGTGTGPQKFFAVDIKTKEYIWAPKELPYRIQTKPLVTGDTIYLSSYHDLFSISIADGSFRWHIEEFGQNGGEPIRAPPALADETLYVPTAEGNVYAVEDA